MLLFMGMVTLRIPENGVCRLMLGILGSVMVGFTLFRFRKYHFPLFMMAVFGGFFLGIFISLAFQSVSGNSNYYVMSFVTGICITLLIYQAYSSNKINRRFIFKIYATSMMGSYLVMRGFSSVIGGYPTEIAILSEWAKESSGQTA